MIYKSRPTKKLITFNKSENLIVAYVAIIFVAIQIFSNSIFPIILGIQNSSIIKILLYSSFIIILIVAYPNYKFQTKSLLLIIGTGLSIVVNDIDPKYMSGTRWILWIIMLSTIGPIFSSKILLKIRLKILDYFLYAFIIVTVLSFIYYLLGIPKIGRGDFGGVINHSMRLGPIAALSGIFSFYNYLINNKIKLKSYYLIISIISALVVIIAASRLAFAGYIAGMIFLFMKPFKFRIFYISLVVLMGITIYSRVEEGGDKVEKSIDKSMIHKGTNNSRETLWSDRINEFKSSPLFGVGFSAQNDYITDRDAGFMGGRVEPGSGYLMMLSMTGLFGFISFLWYLYFLFNSKIFWGEIFNNEVYKLSIFAFFAVHFIGEGYVYSVGSIFAVLFWLMIGISFPYLNVKKTKVKIIDKNKI